MKGTIGTGQVPVPNEQGFTGNVGQGTQTGAPQAQGVIDKHLLDNFNQYLDLLIAQQHKAMEHSDNTTLMYRSQGSVATLRRLKLKEEILGVKNEK